MTTQRRVAILGASHISSRMISDLLTAGIDVAVVDKIDVTIPRESTYSFMNTSGYYELLPQMADTLPDTPLVKNNLEDKYYARQLAAGKRHKANRLARKARRTNK